MRNVKIAASVSAYAAAIWLANQLTAHYGMVSTGFGLTVTAGTFAAGFALLARDITQEAAGRAVSYAALLLGVVLTALTAPQLATASASAFLVAETVDFAVYCAVRHAGWARAAVASAVVAAPVDTAVFLHVAGFPLTWHSMAGQLVAKLLFATLLPVLAIVGGRAVLRQSGPRSA